MGNPQTDQYRDLFIWRKLTENDIAEYRQQGYLRYGPILTDAGLQHMRNQCMEAWRQEKGEFDPTKTWLENSLVTNVHHRAQVVRDFYFRGPMVDVAEHLIGPNLKGATSQLTFKLRGNTMPFDWHQDNAYGELDPYNSLTCLTAMDDADRANGCLWLIPGSHHKGQAKSRHTQEDKQKHSTISLKVDESGAVPVPMMAGETLVMHCWMLHKSEGNLSKDRDRRILFLRYADADAVEVYNDRRPRLGPLVRGRTRFAEVEAYETDLDSGT